jgi:chemotaxis protein MotD
VTRVAIETLPNQPALPPRAKAARDDAPPRDDFSSMIDAKASRPPEVRPQAAERPDRVERPERPDPARPNRETANRRDDAAPAAKVSADRRDDASAARPDKTAPADQPDKPTAKSDAGPSDAPKKDAGADASAQDKAADTPAATASPVAASPIVPQPVVPQPVATPDAGIAGPLSIAAAALASSTATANATPSAPTEAAAAATTDAAAATTAIVAAPQLAVTAATGTTEKTPQSAKAETKAADSDADDQAGTLTKADGTAATPGDAAAAKPADAKPDGQQTVTAKDQAKDTPIQPAAHDRHAAPQPAAASLDTSATTAVPTPQHQHVAAATPAAAPQLTAIVSQTAAVPLNGLAMQISANANNGKTSFEIRLDPAELGRIDVRLDVDRHGNVTSHLTVEKPETLAMLRQDAPQLQRALNDAGLQTSDSGLQFSLGDQSQANQNNRNDPQNNNGPSQRLVVSDDELPPAVMAGRSYGRALSASSGVDIRI